MIWQLDRMSVDGHQWKKLIVVGSPLHVRQGNAVLEHAFVASTRNLCMLRSKLRCDVLWRCCKLHRKYQGKRGSRSYFVALASTEEAVPVRRCCLVSSAALALAAVMLFIRSSYLAHLVSPKGSRTGRASSPKQYGPLCLLAC